MPYIDRQVALGTARGEDLHWYAESYLRAGKFTQAQALLKDDPSGFRKLLAQLPVYKQMVAQLNSGIAASQQGRFGDAVVDLQKASKQFLVLRQALPGEPDLARRQGLSLGYLANALLNLKRSGEALALDREGLAVYESLNEPNPLDCYNMAVACNRIAGQLDHGLAEEREKLESRAVRYLRRAVEGNPDQYLARLTARNSFGQLRGRADFRDLMADATFPRDPFVQPSPVSPSVPETPGAGDANTLLARKNQGHALLAAGRTLDGLSVLASASASDPKDTLLIPPGLVRPGRRTRRHLPEGTRIRQ